MTSENLTQLTEQELLQEEKKLKNRIMIFRVIVVFFVIALIYSIVKKGSSGSSIIGLLAFASLLLSFEQKYKAVQAEIQSRKSQ